VWHFAPPGWELSKELYVQVKKDQTSDFYGKLQQTARQREEREETQVREKQKSQEMQEREQVENHKVIAT
jgi:hypothetical protein